MQMVLKGLAVQTEMGNRGLIQSDEGRRGIGGGRGLGSWGAPVLPALGLPAGDGPGATWVLKERFAEER